MLGVGVVLGEMWGCACMYMYVCMYVYKYKVMQWYRRFGTNRVDSHEVMALRRASKHYFPSFSIFKPAKREKGRNASDDSFLSMFHVYIVFGDVLIFLVYVCIFYHEAYIAFLYVYVCTGTDLKHN